MVILLIANDLRHVCWRLWLRLVRSHADLHARQRCWARQWHLCQRLGNFGCWLRVLEPRVQHCCAVPSVQQLWLVWQLAHNRRVPVRQRAGPDQRQHVPCRPVDVLYVALQLRIMHSCKRLRLVRI